MDPNNPQSTNTTPGTAQLSGTTIGFATTPTTGASYQAPANTSVNSPPTAPPAPPGPPPEAPKPPPPWRSKGMLKLLRPIGLGVLILSLLIGGFFVVLARNKQAAKNSLTKSQTNANLRFDPINLPLSDIVKAGQLAIDNAPSLSINGQLKLNNSLIITPTGKPNAGVTGQIYYDQTSNELQYYNGTEFTPLANSNDIVKSVGGLGGNIQIGSTLTTTGGVLDVASPGVLSLQGQTGNVNFTSGGGLAINGTTLTNTGVLSVGGQTGNITVGNGLSASGGTLRNTGIVSASSGSPSIVVTNDGNGNITISNVGAGTGTVTSSGGTTNRLAKFTGTQNIEDSLISDDGSLVTVNGNLQVTGALTLGTLLSVANGGTGAASLANNGVLVGQGTSPITSVTAGGSGLCLMSTAGAPSFQACPGGGGGGVTSLNGLSGALTVANASAAGSTITINDASTTQKGIASFNSLNFTASAGAVNTIQNIDTTATPTFAGINTNSVAPMGSPLTVGLSSQNLTLQGANTQLSATSGANSTTLSFAAPTANVTYRLQSAAAGTYDVCTTVGNCVNIGGAVTTPGGTTNRIPKFTGAQTLGDSSISDNGSLVTVNGNLTVTGTTTLSTPLAVTSGGTGAANASAARINLGAAASGANSDITSLSGLTTALSVTQGGTGATSLTSNGVLLGNGTSAISSLAAGSAGQCLVSTIGAPVWQTCPGSGGVTSVNGETGVVTIANASASAGTVTIDNASTSQKGIAQFNATNFTASSGIVNTAQDINTTAAPTFARLNITSSQASNPMVLVNNTNASGTGNLIDLQLNGASRLAVTAAGNMTVAGTINGQTISSTASLTGTLAVAGAASLNGGATVAGTLTANTITPSGALTVGATNQSFLMQGNASSTITATSGANTTSVAFQTPTANVTYRLLTAGAGTYDICTTVGNCAGVGGGVTTPGGTPNQLAKFTGSQAIGDSIITDDGSTVSIAGALAVNTITPSGSMTVGDTGQDLTLQGAATSITATAGASTNTLTFATPSGSNKTITLPNASGTVAVSASGPLQIDANGNLTCSACVTSGGGGGGQSAVDSINGQTGAVTLNNATGGGGSVTIDDASTTQKGIAQFNSTNFTASSGTINTAQDINVTAAPTFARINVTSGQASNDMLLVNNTNASGTGNLIDLQLNGASRFKVTPAGNVTLTGTINGQTISSTANLTGSLAVAGAASLNGGATVSGVLTANTITPTGALTVGATNQSFTLQGNASSTITATSGANTTSVAFQTPTASVTYRLLTAAAGTYDICTTVGNCAGVGGGVTTPGGTTNKVAKFTGTQAIGDSIITDNGSTVSIGGTLAVNTITPTGALTIGDTGQNLTLQGAGTSLSATSGSTTNTLTFATPSGSNKTITLPNATGTVAVSASGPLAIDASGNITCATCTTGTPVTSLNGLTGALSIANASGTGSTVTINDASTSQKGIAQFNGVNFSTSGGVVNTIQDINTTAAPTFGRVTVTSNQASNDMLVVNNTNTGATGNLLALQLNGSSRFTVDAAGNVVASGTLTSNAINGQTITSAANFTGTLALAGLASLNGGATVAGTLTANTITSTAAMTVGNTAQNLTLQGAATSIKANNAGNTTTLSLQTPTANVTYRLLTAAAGTYDICTTAGNCVGLGNSITGTGTSGTFAKFTGANTIGNSSVLSETGNIVSIINGALEFAGTQTATFTTPVGSNVGSKIAIQAVDPGSFGQILALGVPSSAQGSSRVVSLFDARAAAHQPTIAIFSPDETQAAGFSWEGSNSTAYVKTTGGNLAFRSNTTDIVTMLSGGNVGIGLSPSYKLDVAGDVNIGAGNAYKIGGTNICTASGCTMAAGSGNYIQNQNSVDQTANMRISGVVQANTSVLSPLLDTASAGTLSLGTTNATAINLDKATTVTGNFVQSGGTFSMTGSSSSFIGTTSGTLTLQSQSSSNRIFINGTTMSFDSGSQINLGSANTSTLNIGAQTNNARTINIGNAAATNAQTVNIGGLGTSAVTVQGGTGSNAITLQATTGGDINLSTTGSGGDLNITTGSKVLVRSTTDSTTAFQIVNNLTLNTVFNADTSNARVGINMSNPSYTLDVFGDINVGALSNFRRGGTSGASTTCSSNQVLQNQVVAGGITTGGSCATAIDTLQTAYDNSSSPATITTSAAGKGISIAAGAVHTTDILSITNAGQGITTAGVEALSVNYVGGSAAVESSGMRVDLTPGGTSGGTWSGMRVVANSTGAASGVNEYGIKVEGPSSPGAGTEIGVNVTSGWDIGMNISSGGLQLSTQSDPSSPATDTLRVYAKNFAGKAFLTVRDEDGNPTPMQSAIFSKSIFWGFPKAGSADVDTTTPFGVGDKLVGLGNSSYFSTTQNSGWVFGTSNAISGNRVGGTGEETRKWYRGSTAGANGFFAQTRIYLPEVTANYTGSTRLWVGMVAQTGSNAWFLSDTPTQHRVGFSYVNAGGGRSDTNWQFTTYGGTQSLQNTNMALTGQKIYDLYTYCAAQCTTVYWRIDNVTDGTTQEGSTSSNLPTNSTALASTIQIGSPSAERFVEFQHIYVEADK